MVNIPQYPRNRLFPEVNGLFEQTIVREADIRLLQGKIKAGVNALKHKILVYKGPDAQDHANNYNALVRKYERLLAALDNILAYDVQIRSGLIDWNLGKLLPDDKPMLKPAVVTPAPIVESKPEIKEEPIPVKVEMAPNNLKIEPAKVESESNGVAENGKQ
mgnify:CR=1 FL=1